MGNTLYKIIDCSVTSVEPKRFHVDLGGDSSMGGNWLEAVVEGHPIVKKLILEEDYDIQTGDSLRAYISLRSDAERGEPEPEEKKLPDPKPINPRKISRRKLARLIAAGPFLRTRNSHVEGVFWRRRHERNLELHYKRKTLRDSEYPFKLEVFRDRELVATYEDKSHY